MREKNKKQTLIVIAVILSVLGCLCTIFYPNSEVNNTIGTYQNIVIDEIQVIDENIVVEDITENEELSSDENTIDVATIEDEEKLETEKVEEIEIEGFQLQDEENISYDGDRAKTWNVELGAYQGLTYFSQLDGRWKNNIYSVTR